MFAKHLFAQSDFFHYTRYFKTIREAGKQTLQSFKLICADKVHFLNTNHCTLQVLHYADRVTLPVRLHGRGSWKTMQRTLQYNTYFGRSCKNVSRG